MEERVIHMCAQVHSLVHACGKAIEVNIGCLSSVIPYPLRQSLMNLGLVAWLDCLTSELSESDCLYLAMLGHLH